MGTEIVKIEHQVLTDLLNNGVKPDDVQDAVGHANPWTTRQYDRRTREVTRNIVERFSI
jgi:integrase